jgi:hypothetical protein
MSRAARSLFAFLFLFTALSAVAATDPVYTALRAARPDGRTITLNNFSYDRDAFHFTLNGKLHLLQPVEGKTLGAVFIGQGKYELKPAMPAERRQLAIHADNDALATLSEDFESAVFLGIPLPAAALQTGTVVSGSPDPAATDRWADYMKHQRKDMHWNVHIRLLQDLLNPTVEPYFAASLNGKKYPPMLIQVDPREVEQTTLDVVTGTKAGRWYSSRYRTEIEKGMAPVRKPLADADDYVIDTKVAGAELHGTTAINFTAISDLRVLPINLMGKLRISEVMWSPSVDEPQWTATAFVQEDKDEDADAAVIFPSMLKKDQMHILKITYAGPDALIDAGDGNYTVTARESWYPNVGTFDDLATYELRFRAPQKMTVVAVGQETENKVEGDERVSVWKTPEPVRVAGFNYGKFKKLSQTDKESGVAVAVYTNSGTPDIIRVINDALASGGRNDDTGTQDFGLEGMLEGMSSSNGPTIHVDTTSLAQSALADAINTARTGNEYFGPLQTKSVSITQQTAWFSGQSWPSLIYLPYLAFINSTTRMTLGLTGLKDFVDMVGPHEFAHQWWGHQIGHKTYRDQWLDEGFAEFTAALVAQQTGGWPAYNRFFENERRFILMKAPGSLISNDQAGPISQGWRLSTWKNDIAPSAIMYGKGAYVLHMLRMAMWDAKTGDADFKAMMRDFASTYAGKNPSTLDFQRIAEKHITPSLKVTATGKLDWFFGEWVDGTAIPKYDAKFDFTSLGGNKYKVTGSITQSEVPETFGMIVPMYVQFDKKTTVRFGSSLVVGSQTKPMDFEITLPKKPMKFLINVNHDVLAR